MQTTSDNCIITLNPLEDSPFFPEYRRCYFCCWRCLAKRKDCSLGLTTMFDDKQCNTMSEVITVLNLHRKIPPSPTRDCPTIKHIIISHKTFHISICFYKHIMIIPSYHKQFYEVVFYSVQLDFCWLIITLNLEHFPWLLTLLISSFPNKKWCPISGKGVVTYIMHHPQRLTEKRGKTVPGAINKTLF